MHDSLAIGKKVLILLLMYNNGKRVSFETQKLYKNRESFHKAMKQLKKASFIKSEIRDRHINIYKLTLNGIIATEEVLKNIE